MPASSRDRRGYRVLLHAARYLESLSYRPFLVKPPSWVDKNDLQARHLIWNTLMDKHPGAHSHGWDTKTRKHCARCEAFREPCRAKLYA